MGVLLIIIVAFIIPNALSFLRLITIGSDAISVTPPDPGSEIWVVTIPLIHINTPSLESQYNNQNTW
jgi:hypothetical protein